MLKGVRRCDVHVPYQAQSPWKHNRIHPSLRRAFLSFIEHQKWGGGVSLHGYEIAVFNVTLYQKIKVKSWGASKGWVRLTHGWMRYFLTQMHLFVYGNQKVIFSNFTEGFPWLKKRMKTFACVTSLWCRTRRELVWRGPG